MRESTEDRVRGDIGNFPEAEVTNSSVQASRLLLPLKYKALGLARTRAFAVLSQGPWLFLTVVLGVAVLFKLGIGWMQPTPEAEPSAAVEKAPLPPEVRPEDGRGREAAAKAPASPLRFEPDPSAQPLPAQAAPPPPLPRAKKPRRPSIRP